MRIIGVFFAALLAGLIAVPAVADAPLRQAMSAVQDKDWSAAERAVARHPGQGAAIVAWHKLRAGQGSFQEYQRFVANHGDWPGLPLLRRKGEAQIPEGADPQQVLAYFADQSPQTGAGLVRLIQALSRLGKDKLARDWARLGWADLILDPDSEAFLLERYSAQLRDRHVARLDMLLWRNAPKAALRMLPRVGRDHQLWAEARLALQARSGKASARVRAVPASLKGDPGLSYDRFEWRIRKGLQADAIAMMRARSTSAQGLGRPEAWSNRRRSLAREMMREGQHKLAYELASRHHLTSGSDYADLEWLSGYLALRYLGRPKQAETHFKNHKGAVQTPISLGRAGYWIGRARQAAGDAEGARRAYTEGAKYQTSFYGLLAAHRAKLPLDPALAGGERFPDWRQGAFTRSTVFRAAQDLLRAGQPDLAERFLRHLGETQDRMSLGQMGDFALSLDRPHLAVMIAKRAASMGHVTHAAYYPIHPLGRLQLGVAPELALSIARRESEFDPKVVSGVGARGMMQLMPRTAREMARKTGQPISLPLLLNSWRYNVSLGSAYLDQLQDEFGDSPVLVAAAYNAGPTRARRWIRERGDPRDRSVDLVDWIEHIPFRETRNYVMRVLESLTVYRARLSGQVGPNRIVQDLRGSRQAPAAPVPVAAVVQPVAPRPVDPVRQPDTPLRPISRPDVLRESLRPVLRPGAGSTTR